MTRFTPAPATLLATAAALAALGACTPVLPTIGGMPVLEGAKLQVVGTQTLPPVTARSFQEFANENEQAFGAMYISATGEDWYWRTGSFSLDDVKQEAKVACEVYTNGAPCTLYATWTAGDPTVGVGFPTRSLPDINLMIDGTLPGRYAAIATMPVGAYGFAYNYLSQQEAASIAMEECEIQADVERGVLDADERAAYNANGLFDCEIFMTFRN